MLHRKVPEHPRTQDDNTLENHPFLFIPVPTGRDFEYAAVQTGPEVGQKDERQEYEGAEKGVQKKDGDYGIAVKGFLLERIIKAKQDGRNKSK